MARGAAISIENSFNKGLVTEYTGMNFPEQAAISADNVVFSEFGEVSRRLGIDQELNGVVQGLDTSGAVIEYEWYSVSNDGSVRLVVQQLGRDLHFFSVSSTGALSAGRRPFSVDIATFLTPGSSVQDAIDNECTFTTGRGYLFVTHPFCEPFYVEYDQVVDTISVNPIQIQIRDLAGVDDGLPIDFKPTTLSNLHHYNLLNQGWYDTFFVSSARPFVPVLDLWRGNEMTKDVGRNDWPSNANIWWLSKRTATNDDFIEPGLELFDAWLSDKTSLGNTPAPRGHYIYPAFNVNRTGMTGIAGLPTDTSGRSRPSTCAFYAGRVWYAGTSANKYSTRVYFSQLVEDEQQFGKCFQINDPTSETTFDLIDTDGGVLELPLIESVTAMIPVKDSLIIVGTNGVYLIRGSDTGPFRATNYVVEFVSNIGSSSSKSLVVADTGITWWGHDAIYALVSDQSGFSFQVENISKNTIQGVVDSVPQQNVRFIKGAHSRREKIVRWIFSDSISLSGYAYNRVLELNTDSSAFYTYTLPNTSVHVCGILISSGQGVSTVQELVTDTIGSTVTTSTSESVTIPVDVVQPVPEVFKFSTRHPSGFIYSEIWRTSYTDWQSYGAGINYLSYFESGYRIRGDFLRNFNSSPISIMLRNGFTEQSCIVKTRWDFGARESIPQELYYAFVPSNQEFFQRRMKFRGKGKAMTIRYESQGALPFHVCGWAGFDTGGSQP